MTDNAVSLAAHCEIDAVHKPVQMDRCSGNGVRAELELLYSHFKKQRTRSNYQIFVMILLTLSMRVEMEGRTRCQVRKQEVLIFYLEL